MIPMPIHLNEAWGTVWTAANPHYFSDGPWWDYNAQRRCDGLYLIDRLGKTRADIKLRDPRTLWNSDKEAPSEAMSRIDKKHPLPAPPPMPGQVWAFPDGEAQITAVERALLYRLHERPEDAKLHLCPVWSTPLIRLNRQWHVTEAEWQGGQWPIRGAILVAGPTPWGRDVPWTPSESTLHSTRPS